MFIIWGSKVYQKQLGIVADKCVGCGKVEAFTVTEHYRVGHIYFIPLGTGTCELTTGNASAAIRSSPALPMGMTTSCRTRTPTSLPSTNS